MMKGTNTQNEENGDGDHAQLLQKNYIGVDVPSTPGQMFTAIVHCHTHTHTTMH